tara:strand:- start:313 stop:507 length:195 start_codon:yes stop_codon:yes gene_type:complete
MEGEIEVNLINKTIEDLKRIDVSQQIIKLLADEIKIKQKETNKSNGTSTNELGNSPSNNSILIT